MRIVPRITAIVFFALGLFWLWVSFVGILTPPGGKIDIAMVAGACFLSTLVIIMTEIVDKLQNIYELLHQRDEKDKRKLRPIRDFDSDEMILDTNNSSEDEENQDQNEQVGNPQLKRSGR